MSSSSIGGASRSRWAAVGAALAVAVGAGGLLTASAADSAQSTFVGTTPCRVVDTRAGSDNVGPRSTPIGPKETFSTAFVGAVGRCNIPANAVAVVLNLAIVNPTANSFLTVFPAGGEVPLAANLNFVAGQPPASNAATVQIGAGGQLSFYNLAGTVDVTADVSGYYLPAGTPAPTPQPATIVYSPFEIAWENAGSSNNRFDGCHSLTTGAGWGTIPLTLPAGTLIHSLSARVRDGATSGAFSVELIRRGATSTGTSRTSVLEVSGGGAGNIVLEGFATSSSDFVVTETDYYELWVDLGSNAANWFCSATITVTMP